MDETKAAEQLTTIRRIMESATQITVLPGWAAIIGGLIALAGCAATWVLMGSLDFAVIGRLEPPERGAIIVIWVAVGVLAVLVDIALTVRLARKRGKNPFGRLSQLAAYAMGPAIVAALALSLAMGLRGAWGFVPAIWMIHYGLAIWVAGILSIRAPGVLGLVFMLAGVLTLFWAAPISLVMVALTFGLSHIIFGIYLLARFGS